MFNVTFYVTHMIDVDVPGDTFEQAMEAARKKKPSDLVKVKHGVSVSDHQIQVYSVHDMDANGEM